MATTQYNLRWSNYLNHLSFAFESLRSEQEFTDVTLYCEGKKIYVHKMILSACSSYFRDVLKENPHPNPVIIFKNVKHSDLLAIITFMYQGEVSVAQELLPTFLQTAELLQVRGLTETNFSENAKVLAEEEMAAQTHAAQIQQIQAQQQQQQQQQHQKPAETLFLAIPQEANKIVTALTTSTPLKTTQTLQVQSQASEVATLKTAGIVEAAAVAEKVGPSVKKRKRESTVQTTYLNITKDGEIVEDEDGVNFLPGGMKMEIPEFIDMGSTGGGGEERIQETGSGKAGEYVTGDTYELVEGAIIKQTLTASAEEEVGQEQGEGDEMESADISGMFTSQSGDDLKSNVQEGDQYVSAMPGAASNSAASKSTLCITCQRTFTSASALKRHRLSKHSNLTQKFTCTSCNVTYKTKWSLSTHISRYHRQPEEKRQKQSKVPTALSVEVKSEETAD